MSESPSLEGGRESSRESSDAALDSPLGSSAPPSTARNGGGRGGWFFSLDLPFFLVLFFDDLDDAPPLFSSGASLALFSSSNISS